MITHLLELEIDGVSYKRGVINYNKAIFTDGKISQHLVTFSGRLSNLSDIIGDTKLPELAWHRYNHDPQTWVDEGVSFSGKVVTSPFFQGQNIIYPLINSSATGWTESILSGTSTHEIKPEDLKPAILFDNVLVQMSNYYAGGSGFGGFRFDTHPDFDTSRLYMWCGNEPEDNDNRQTLTFDSWDGNGPNFQRLLDVNTGIFYPTQDNIGPYSRLKFNVSISGTSGQQYLWRLMKGQTDSDEYINRGDPIYQWGGITDVTNFEVEYSRNEFGFQRSKFLIEPILFDNSGLLNINISIQGQYSGTWYQIGEAVKTGYQMQRPVDEEMAMRVPAVKVMDWLKGVVQMFNLVPVHFRDGFKDYIRLTPYNTWLADGQIELDITRWVNESTWAIDIPDIPKEIQFKYQDPTAEDNVEFRDYYGRGYGDLINTSAGGSGKTFKVELPFENLFWYKIPNTEYLIGRAHTRDGGTYNDTATSEGIYVDLKPIAADTVMWMYWALSAGTGNINIKGKAPISEWKLCNTFSSSDSGATSLNFNYDFDNYIDTVSGRTDVVNLYAEYETLMNSLTSPTSRIYYYEGYIPISVLSQIKLNDLLKIKDRVYTINKLQVNTIDGKAKLELLHYYREAEDGVAPLGDNVPPQTCAIWIVTGDEVTQPSSLTGTSVTATGFTLCWSASTSPGQIVTQYHVYADGVLYDSVSGSPATTCINITGQTSGSTVCWTVGAEDDANNFSLLSTPLCVKQLGPSALTFINPLTLVSTGSTYLEISWPQAIPSDDAAITGYTAYVDGVSWISTTSAVLTTTLGGLTANTCYDITVVVGDFSGATDTSTVLSACTGYGDPSIPIAITSSGITTSGFTLSWDASIPPSGCTISAYHIYQDGVHNYTVTGGTSISISGLTAGSTSLWQVKAIDSCGGESGLSVGLNVTTTSVSTSCIFQTLNQSAGPGSMRTQYFELCETVVENERYNLEVYGVTVWYIVQAGDTFSDVIDGLVIAVNNTTYAQWDALGQAPESYELGASPVATAFAGINTIILDLNYSNQFSAYIM
jgi:hypothetical protein